MNCPICNGNMMKVKDRMKQDNVDFEVFKYLKCGEELLDMTQLKILSSRYL